MENQIFWIIIVILGFVGAASRSPECANEPKCLVQPVHKMTGVDCYDRRMKTFPKCLPSDAEVIDATYNRIRKVSNSDLTRYKYLTFLYLKDNLIFNLDDEAFNDMNYLTCLDLSENALTKVPRSIFQLPSLQKLYLSQNLNINMVESIERAKPIYSPIGMIDLGFTTDEDNIYDFPDFGPMPYLKELRLTGNKYSGMSPKSFTGMCQLKTLYLENVTIEFTNDCDCWTINMWLIEHDVDFQHLPCRVDAESCLNTFIPEEDLGDYHLCNIKHAEFLKGQQIKKISIGLAVVGALLILLLVFYFWKCYNRKNIQRARQEENTLLNNQQKGVQNDYV